MADALCGPSNALQNFQKHSTIDRTLQQDRLATTHSPSQGFRSSPGPSAGLLDPEFEAFQAGQIPLPHPEAQQFHPAGFPNSYAPQQPNQPASTAWASDFQHLSIATPPQFQQRNYAQQSQPGQVANGWQNEFANQQSQPLVPVSSNHTGYNSVPFQRLSTIAPMTPLQSSSYSVTASRGQVEQSQAQSTEAFDEEAFARAFDQAAESELAMEQAEQQQTLGIDHDVLADASAERLIGSDQVLEPQRLGADLIHDPREGDGEQQQRQDDPDALARTAGQLLESVRDNHSDKFQKSQFLELMRQLRDREVMVEGDKIVGVKSQESKGVDTLEKSLLSIARQLSLLDFARVEPLLAPAPSSSSFRPVSDQLILGAFIRTLMQVSAALDTLLSQYPDIMQHAKPFGMSIGVEVFALANNPLVNAYPTLKTLVLSFKSQFSELGIDPRMVRRRRWQRTTDPLPVQKKKRGKGEKGEQEEDEVAPEVVEEEEEEEGEMQLRTWLGDWLTGVNERQSRGAAAWLLSSEQIRELLGPDIYPTRRTTRGKETGPRPTQAHLDRMRDILGARVMDAMQKIRTSPHTRVFANPLIADVEAFSDYVCDVARLEAEPELEPELELETLFPSGLEESVLAWTTEMEDDLQQLLEEEERRRNRRREQLLSFDGLLQASEEQGRESWLSARGD